MAEFLDMLTTAFDLVSGSDHEGFRALESSIEYSDNYKRKLVFNRAIEKATEGLRELMALTTDEEYGSDEDFSSEEEIYKTVVRAKELVVEDEDINYSLLLLDPECHWEEKYDKQTLKAVRALSCTKDYGLFYSETADELSFSLPSTRSVIEVLKNSNCEKFELMVQQASTQVIVDDTPVTVELVWEKLWDEDNLDRYPYELRRWVREHEEMRSF